MELINDFDVSVGIDDAWAVLTDIETIAPCLPGAELQEVEGDEYRGIVKIKVGPISAKFKGKAAFDERDETAHKAVLKAEGRDTAGKGNASATITAELSGNEGGGTHVIITTDLNITGRVAQFGRGALADVSTKLMDQFVESLETEVLADRSGDADRAAPAAAEPSTAALDDVTDEPAITPAEAPGDEVTAPAPEASASVYDQGDQPPANPAPASDAPVVRRIDSPPTKPVDLLGTAGAPVLKRLLPVGIGALILLLLLRRLRR